MQVNKIVLPQQFSIKHMYFFALLQIVIHIFLKSKIYCNYNFDIIVIFVTLFAVLIRKYYYKPTNHDFKRMAYTQSLDMSDFLKHQILYHLQRHVGV